jgi:hypothetical protein
LGKQPHKDFNDHAVKDGKRDSSCKKKRADLFSLLVDSVVQINLASPI